MKKGIFKIIVFICCLIVCDRLLGAYLSNLYEKNYCMHSGGELNAYLKSESPDTLFMGSSRVNTMIDPEFIGKSVQNLTQSAKHFLYHLSVVDLLDQQGKMPSKMLVMNIEVEDLYVENMSRLIDDVFYLKYYYGKNDLITSLIKGKNKYVRLKFLSSSYRFNGENFRLLTNPLQDICKKNGKGYTPLGKTKNDSLRLAVGVEEMKTLSLKQINPEIFKHLKHLMNLCEKNNVKLVILYAPNYYYPESFRKASNRVKSFCKKYNINYLDFSFQQDSVFNQQSLWFDHIHLNEEGAKIYTKMLKERLGTLQQ